MKLKKINLRKTSEFLSDKQMKSILGGYEEGLRVRKCSQSSSSCSGTCSNGSETGYCIWDSMHGNCACIRGGRR